jgi:hypothetical protein
VEGDGFAVAAAAAAVIWRDCQLLPESPFCDTNDENVAKVENVNHSRFSFSTSVGCEQNAIFPGSL